MKRFSTYMTMLVLAAMTMTLTGCEYDDYYDDPWWYSHNNGSYGYNNNYYNGRDDYGNSNNGNTIIDEAQVLAGEWGGTAKFYNNATGETAEYNASFIFVQNNSTATKGTGIEQDYIMENGQITDEQTLHFDWYIAENGNIYVKYASGNTFVLDAAANQHGFWLSEKDGTFEGYMLGSNNNDYMYINLSRVRSYAKGTTSIVRKDYGSSFIAKPNNDKIVKKLPKR